MNKTNNIKGSISFIHLLKTQPSAEERQALSAKMAHAPITQIKYLCNQGYFFRFC